MEANNRLNSDRGGNGGEEDHRHLLPPDAASFDNNQRSDPEPTRDYSHGLGDPAGRDAIMLTVKKEKDQLECARSEMTKVKEENQRLKLYLDQILRDYKSLQMQFLGVVRKGDRKPSADSAEKNENDNARDIDRESQLVSLSLGRAPPLTVSELGKENERIDRPSSSRIKCDAEEENDDQSLKLGLECKFGVSESGAFKSTLPSLSPISSFEEQKGEDGENWPPSKSHKTARSGDDEVSQHSINPVKKARVSVRARCDTPTMNDGCQWRKYGQKIAKGNPCPRAYYRCTVAPSCPVRKQVQRCIEDMSILITTYEGTHNHPLPMSATAMASTTSAAAQMLLSGSSSSSPNLGQGHMAAADIHGGVRSLAFYLPTAPSSSSSCPTITLDLTSSNPSTSSLFSRFNPSTYSTYSPTLTSMTTRPFSSASTLSFNSSDLVNGALPITTSWGINNGNGLLSYGNSFYNTYLQRNSSPSTSNIINSNPTAALPDTIAAATKAITADPSFQSVLAAALKSIIGGGNNVAPGNPSGAQP